MRIIIAPDSFKGSLTALEAACAMEKGVRAVIPDAEIEIIPIADGGEGTLQVLMEYKKGKYIEAEASDPLGRPIKGKYGIIENGKTAIIEMSTVSGLLLLKKEEQNPLYTTTYGTGLLIKNAVETGCRELIIGIGGSATNDCGTGMAQALGVKFFRKDKTMIIEKMCGMLLNEVESFDFSKLHPAIKESRILVASDVNNPLLGENGCTRVYSPQKGATPEIVMQLEKNMEKFIELAEKSTKRSVCDIPGAGAAGGLGAGLMLFTNAEIYRGVDIILDTCNFSERIKKADIILTGEGKIDNQTAFGKVIAGIALRAKTQQIPVMAFAGKVENAEGLNNLGVKYIYPICQYPIPIEQAMANAKTLLQDTVESVIWEYMLC